MRKRPIQREIGAQSHNEKYDPPIVIKIEGTSKIPPREPPEKITYTMIHAPPPTIPIIVAISILPHTSCVLMPIFFR